MNVAILGMGSDPADTAVQGQHVKIWVDVINNGPSALNVPVQLAFPSNDKQPERKSTRVEPGTELEITRVEFVWKTANYDIGDPSPDGHPVGRSTTSPSWTRPTQFRSHWFLPS